MSKPRKRIGGAKFPRTQDEILRWLQPLLSKQYDTEETALHAVEEYRDEAVLMLAGEPSREPTSEEHEGLDGLDRSDYFAAGFRAGLHAAIAKLTEAGQ